MVQFYMLQLDCFISIQFTQPELGLLQGILFALIPSCMGSCHGQILIETETYSLAHIRCSLAILIKQLLFFHCHTMFHRVAL